MATATTAKKLANTTVITLLAANTSRISAILVNKSNDKCHVRYGLDAHQNDFTYEMDKDDTVIVTDWDGIITAEWLGSDGFMMVTEVES